MKTSTGTLIDFKCQTIFNIVHLLRMVYVVMVYSHLNYDILNWARANRSNTWSSKVK